MKRNCIMLGLTVLLVLVVLAVLAVPASAAPDKTYFSSSWEQTAFGYVLNPYSGHGNVWHLDDLQITNLVSSEDDHIAGTADISGAARVLDKDGVWLHAEWTGKFTLTSDQGDVWTGNYTLKNDITGANTVRAVAMGTAGGVTGWVMKFSGYGAEGQPMDVTGYYMEK